MTVLSGIAIVGMAVRAPGARDLDQFWLNLVDGRDCIRRFTPDELDAEVPRELAARPNFVAARGVLDDADCFDAGFFGIGAREATVMDPQQRLLLELAWTALEHAGIDPSRARGPVGVFAGCSNNTWLGALRAAEPQLVAQFGEFATMLANEKDYVATRIAHRLDLTGPAIGVYTACSTSLVAVCQAWYALATMQCDVALAGGASVLLPQRGGYLHVEGGFESSDGRCRPFDAQASGTVFGSGGGMVAMKRLEDAIADGDVVYAVIRGVALNNDGGSKASFMAPSPDGQAAVIRTALAQAGVDARSIGLVEAHGTATPLGDPIEVAALVRAYREDTGDAQYCTLGSVKGNVGHLVAGAGVAGLAKAALALQRRTIPGTVHFSQANPAIDLAASPFRVERETRVWPDGPTPRRAAVSSFGVGGTNAHVVLEEGPATEAGSASSRDSELLVVSARDADALAQRCEALAAVLDAEPAPMLADVAHTLATGRKAFPFRCAVAAREPREAAERLRSARRDAAVALPAARLVFLFPGQGSQHAGMARDLHASNPAFRAALDACLDAAAPHLDFDLRALLLADPGDADAAAQLAHTSRTQPALFCVEYALARMLASVGLEPDAMIGHSVGEYVAACLAGVFGLDDALALIAARGRAMGAQPTGAMLAVRADPGALRPLLGDVEIAGFNAPDLTVVAGSEAAITAFEATLEREVIGASRLAVSHAFHSRVMDGAQAGFARAFERVALHEPSRPFHSCVSGAPIAPADAASADYWVRQLRAPVRFSDAVTRELAQDGTVLLEVGPGQALTQLARRHRTREGRAPAVVALLPSARAPQDAARHACEALGRLWSHGVALDWDRWFAGETRRRVVLPTYPFRRDRYWYSSPSTNVAAERAGPTAEPCAATPAATRRARIEAEATRIFAGLSGCAPGSISREATFLDQGLDSLQLTQAALEVERAFGVKMKLRRLMDDLDSIASLAAMLERELPASAFAEASAPAPTAMNISTAASIASLPEFPTASGPLSPAQVTQLLERQLALIEQQLVLVRALATTPAAGDATSTAESAASEASARSAPEPVVAVMPPAPEPEDAPLTEAQQEIWLTCQFGDAANCSFNESLTLHLDGELDTAAFSQAVDFVVARHDAFRLRFAPDGMHQRVAHDEPVLLAWLDFTEGDADAAYDAHCVAEAMRPFDLEHGPLARATLARLAPERHRFHFIAHHLVFDGWGASVLVEEILVAYRALREGSQPPFAPAPSFLAYAREQASEPARAAAAEDLAWWLEHLEGAPPALELPIDRPRPATMTFAGATVRQSLEPALWSRVREAAARYKASPYAFLLAVHATLLARLSGQRDLVVAFPQAGQAKGPWVGLVGDCVSFLPLRIRVEPGMRFGELLESVRASLLDAAEHGRCTFVELARTGRFAREGTRMPLAQTVLTLNPRYVLPPVPGLETHVTENPKRHVRWDLLLIANENGDLLELDAQYDSGVFEAATMRRWMGLFRTMADRAAADPSLRIEALDTEAVSLAANPDAPAVALDDGHTALSLFLERARAEPQRPAIAARGVRLSYGEVERDSARVAALLVDAGVARGDVVAIALPRRAEVLAAALGAWRAGAAYAPLDPTHPGERLDYMAATAGARVVVTLREARLPQRLLDGRVRIDVDRRSDDTDAVSVTGLPAPPQPGDLAYVLFTSGSTGRPKGARILHRGVANMLRQAQHEPGIGAEDALVARATFAFDFAVLELFGPLVAGARVVLADEAEQRDPYSLARLTERERATMLCGTPSQFRAQLAARWPKTPAPLRVVLGGEPVDRPLADELLARTPEVWNIYGPTETTVYSTIERLADDGTTISVGRPIANTRVYVCGDDGAPLPQGATGELVIAGAGVSDGYANAEALTQERYRDDPHTPGWRMYRTGDRATQREDGRLHLHGRLDQQVKLRGFRIELPEIEAIALAHPDVAEAIASVREVAAGDPRLVLHVVPRPGTADGVEARVRAALEAKLPGFMIPQYFVAVAAMPRSPNGKVDRQALALPADVARARGERPASALERELASIWNELLGRTRIGRNDDFFDLGGHSLLAVRLFARIHERFGVNLPLATLLRHRTLAGLATALESAIDSPVGGASAPTAQTMLEGRSVAAEAAPTVIPAIGAENDPWTPLVALRAEGSRPALFLVHAVGGNVLNYRPLADALGGDQPVYGLQAVGLDGASRPLDTIEAMAQRYLPEIRRVQPRGPYRLAGGSMGGVIAFEIASRLVDLGETVDLLALFDTYGPDHPWFGGGFGARVAHARALSPRDRWKLVRDGLRRRARAALYAIEVPLYSLAGREMPHELRYAVLSRVNLKALRRYRFNPYGSRITLFRAAQQPPGIAHGPTLGWDRIAAGGIDVVSLDGTHESFVEEPELGEELRQQLDLLCAKEAHDDTTDTSRINGRTGLAAGRAT